MVSFETEIYNRQADDVIGIKVMVIADNGQTIESIHCVNETDFNDLKAKLDVLNEDFVQFDENSSLQGETIDAILANAAEVVNINATSLGGFQSDEFSKTGHTHLKQSITDLYDYDISLSDYNVSTGDSITVTVAVTNMSGSPVKNHEIIIYCNGVFWKTGRTNNNGVFSSTYTVNSTGLITFSVKNQNIQCFVEKPVDDTGWINIPFASSEFANYSQTSNPLECRRIGDNVYIRGIITNATTLYHCKTQDKIIAILPNGFNPSRAVYQRNQASGTEGFLIRVMDGKISMVANRYGASSSYDTISKGRWLHMYMSYCVG